MKRLIALTSIAGIMALTGCTGTDATNETEQSQSEETSEANDKEVDTDTVSDGVTVEEVEESVEAEPVEVDRKTELESAIKGRIDEGDYSNTLIEKITINDNLGANDGSYIALVNLDFNTKNSRNTANDMMKMYSDDLAASISNKGISDISELAVFWKDDYNNRNLKYAYEYKDGNFFVMDIAGE